MSSRKKHVSLSEVMCSYTSRKYVRSLSKEMKMLVLLLNRGIYLYSDIPGTRVNIKYITRILVPNLQCGFCSYAINLQKIHVF